MKTRVPLLALVTLFAAAFAPAQVPPEPKATLDLTYDLTAKKPLLGATYDVGFKLTDVAGLKGFDLQARPLAGLTGDGSPTLGGVAVFRYNRLSKELFLDVGLGGRAAPGERPHGFLYLGVGRKV